jgi:predicted acetyltransferase
VPVSIRDVRGSLKDQRWIQGVYGEYIESLADLNSGFFSVIGSENARQDEIFANWFSNDHAHPLVIMQGTDHVGFALVTRLRSSPKAEGATYRMSEFFVRPPYRHAGIGRNAATLIFDRFTGDWEIIEYQRHPGSIAFWRRVLAVYCPGKFSERAQNGEVHQRFKSRSSSTR